MECSDPSSNEQKATQNAYVVLDRGAAGICRLDESITICQPKWCSASTLHVASVAIALFFGGFEVEFVWK